VGFQLKSITTALASSKLQLCSSPSLRVAFKMRDERLNTEQFIKGKHFHEADGFQIQHTKAPTNRKHSWWASECMGPLR